MKKKVLSMLTAFALLLSMLPATALAVESDASAGGMNLDSNNYYECDAIYNIDDDTSPVLLTTETNAAQIGDELFPTLAAALSAVKNGQTITLLADNDEDVTITQAKNQSITIDGDDKTYSGTITVKSTSNLINSAETLTIQNLNFVLDASGQQGISTPKNSYAHNITVDNCSFTGVDAGYKSSYGIYLRNAYDVVVKDTKGTGLLDLVYGNRTVTGFAAESITVTDSRNGIWLSYVNSTAEFSNIKIDVDNDGLGFYNNAAGSVTIKSANIEAKTAVYLGEKNDTKKVSVTIEGLTGSADPMVDIDSLAAVYEVSVDEGLVKTDEGDYVMKTYAAAIDEEKFGTLADAIEAVQDGETIKLLVDLDESVIITQKAGVNFTINGDDHTYTGRMTVNGTGKATDAGQGLTIQNVKFDIQNGYAIYSHEKNNYVRNVTVQDCTFTSQDGKTGLWLRYAYDITVKDCTAANLGSFLTSTGPLTDLAVEKVEIKESTNGFTLKYPHGATFKSVVIDVENTGVYLQNNGYSDKVTAFEGCSIKAAKPLYVEVVTEDKILNLEINDSSLKSTDEAWKPVAAESSLFSVSSDKYVLAQDEATGYWTVKGQDPVAIIGEEEFGTLAEAISAVQDGETIKLLVDLNESVTITQKAGVSFTIDGNDHTYTGRMTVNGTGKATDAGQGLTIKNVEFDIQDGYAIYSHAKNNYVRNVTVQDCTFTSQDGKTGLWLRYAYDITVKDCTAANLGSFLTSTGPLTNLAVEKVEIKESTNGFTLKYPHGATFNGVTIEVENTGVYLQNNGYSDKVTAFEDCSIKAAKPLYAEVVTEDKTLNLEVNSSNFTSTDEAWVPAITDSPLKTNGDPLFTVTSDEYTLAKDESLNFWTIVLREYDVTFDSDGGSDIAPQTIKHGGTPVEPDDPTNGDLIFLGWYEGDMEFDFGTKIVKDTALTAKWAAETTPMDIYSVYQVEHYLENLDGTYTLKETEFPLRDKVGEKVSATAKAFENYTVKSVDSDVVVEMAKAGEDGKPDVTTLKVYYDLNQYDVTFDSNGGSAVEKQAVKHGATATEPVVVPTRSGYRFNGWYSDESLTSVFDFTAPITEDTAVYAKWSRNSSGGGGGGGSASYTITVEDAEDGSVSASRTRASSGTIVTITIVPDSGYELDELAVLDKNGKEIELAKKSDNEYTFKMPSSKVTIEATFEEIDEFENPFVDVNDGAYYYDAVQWAAENGITGGTSATTFSPAVTCTRAQTVTFLWRAAGSPEPETTACPFEDVTSEKYYYDAVLWAVENGITVGTSATTFSPDTTVTRAQNVTFLYRWAKSPAVDAANPFNDVASDKYYHDAVIWAAHEGITAGTSATTFSPDDPCLRSQIVTFLYRYLAK